MSDKKYILILVVLHCLLTLPLAFYLNIWMDEASTLYTTQNGFLFALHHSIADERQSPLYFLLLSLWREVYPSFFFARIFSIWCSALAIKLFYNLTRNFFNPEESKFIAAVFALHPILIWASLEIRVYSLVILLSVLLLKFLREGYLTGEDVTAESLKSQKKARIFYFITAVIALYTSYYLGFILVGNFCALLVLKNFQKAKIYFLQMLAVGVCIIPLLLVIRQQFAVNTGGFQEAISLIEGVKALWQNSLNLILPIDFLTTVPSIVMIIRIWLVRLLIVLLVFALIRNKFRDIDQKILLFGTISGVVFAIFLVSYFFVGRDFIALRHTTPLFAPLLLLVFSFGVKLLPQKSRVWIAAAFIFAFFFSYSLYIQYSPLSKRGDWMRVAKFIEENESPGQPIIIFRNYDALSLRPHYHGVNKILPDSNFFAWNNEDSFSSENALKNQTDFILSQIPEDAPEIWVATEEFCQQEKSAPACLPLENFIQANYTIELTRDFYEERLRLLKRR